MYVERAGERLPPKSLGAVLRARYDDSVERVRSLWNRAREKGVPLGTTPDATVPAGEYEPPAYDFSPDLDGLDVVFVQPRVADLDDADLAIAHLRQQALDAEKADDALEQARAANAELRAATRRYLSIVVDAVEGLEGAAGPLVVKASDGVLDEEALELLAEAQLLRPLYLAHQHLRGLTAAEKKRFGSRVAST